MASARFDAKRAGGTRYAVELLDVLRHGAAAGGRSIPGRRTVRTSEASTRRSSAPTGSSPSASRPVADFPTCSPSRSSHLIGAISTSDDDRYTVFRRSVHSRGCGTGAGWQAHPTTTGGPGRHRPRPERRGLPLGRVRAGRRGRSRLSTPQGEDRFALPCAACPTIIAPSVEARTRALLRVRALVPTGTVEYLWVRARAQCALADPLVRRALALATDRAAYAGASGRRSSPRPVSSRGGRRPRADEPARIAARR